MRLFVLAALLAGCEAVAPPPADLATPDLTNEWPAPDFASDLRQDFAPQTCSFNHECPSAGCCGGVCAPLDTNANCGACNNRCEGNVTSTCCPRAERPGCTTLVYDTNNCGGCGKVCVPQPGAQTACCDGQCVDLKTDWRNCGGCSKTCRANQTCSKGVCG